MTGLLACPHAVSRDETGNRAVRSAELKLVTRYPGEWELYNMESDRTELDDLATRYPDTVSELAGRYDEWARRCGVEPWGKHDRR